MEAENCSVCLSDLAEEPGDGSKLIASLEPCKHVFHDGCIQTWFKTFSSCPICRCRVEAVGVSNEVGGPMISSYEVDVAASSKAEVGSDDWLDNLECEGCGLGDDTQDLLICDGCELSWHPSCIGTRYIPDGDWFCKSCASRDGIRPTYYNEHDDVPLVWRHAPAAGIFTSSGNCPSRSANHRRFQQIVDNAAKRQAHARSNLASPSLHRSHDNSWRGRWQLSPERSAPQRSRRRPLSLQTQGALYSMLDAQEHHDTTASRNHEPRKGSSDGSATASGSMSPESPEIKAAWRALEMAKQGSSGAASQSPDETDQTDKPERPRKRPQTRRVPQARPTAAGSGNREAREAAPMAEVARVKREVEDDCALAAGRAKREAEDDCALAEGQGRRLKRPLTRRSR